MVNLKKNDTIYDLPVHTFHGPDFIIEKLGRYSFQVRAKSFFQTNTRQAERLYEVAKNFAALQPSDNVYDLYTGVGSIAIYVSQHCKQVTGIEQIEDAIADAGQNAALNGVSNCTFLAGDVRMTLRNDFSAQHGSPNVIITDPPRAGMHEDVVKTILQLAPQRVVYVSCNPATQARDVAMMNDQYSVEKVQPVDMFPQTTHIENVMLLEHR